MPTAGSSGPQFFQGQKQAFGEAVFGGKDGGGIFADFLAGKPNAGFERAQSIGLKQLQQRNAQMGLSGQPLGTRIESDFLQKSGQAAGDNFMSQLFQFGQPAGTSSSQSLPLIGNFGKG